MNENQTNNRILHNQKRAYGTLTYEDLKNAYNYFEKKCPYSDTPIDENNWHLEHIIPVSMGGTTDSWNCIPVCGPCNLSKGDKHLLDWWDETHKIEEEYKISKIFNYMLTELEKERNMKITSGEITDERMLALAQKETDEEEQVKHDDEYYIETTKKLDTFTFMYQLLNHMIESRVIPQDKIEEYKNRLQEAYNKNEKYEKIDIEIFKNQDKLTKYLKQIKVVKHYIIAMEYADKVSLEEVKINIENIKNYLKKENISDLINKNPNIIAMNIEIFQANMEYLVNILGISKETVLDKPVLLNDILSAKEFYHICKEINFDISLMTNSSFTYGNFKQFIKILKSEEYKEHPELFTSQVLAKSTPEKISAMLKSEEYKEHPELFTSTTLAQSTPEKIVNILSMPEWQEKKYQHLLTCSILIKKKENLQLIIKLSENYQIDNYINIKFLSKSPSQNYALIRYMNDNNIPLIVNDKLNSIFSYQPGMIKKKYNIDLNELIKIYPYTEEQERKSSNAIR